MSADPVRKHRAVLDERHVDGFGTVTLRPVDPEADADVLHQWVSQERARFWGMNGFTREQVLETYGHLDSLTTHHAFLACLDGRPAALFQTYEPEADRISECYEAEPGDIGIHLLIGPPEGHARHGWTSVLVSAFLAWVLSDTAVRRVVAEPDAANRKAIARFARSGFTLGPEIVLPEVDLPEVYLPEKRARLAILNREV
ncbi:GNAT family N-acetyltransferase [Streptomyces sp. NPDC002004]